MQVLGAVTLKQLRAIVALADHGTITAAAEAMRLTAPAVHTQLAALESNFDAPLIDRSRGNRLALTQAGTAVLQAARQIETELDACAAEVLAMTRGMAGRVRLGVVSTGKYFAPALVATLKRDMPEVEVALIVGNRDQIIAALDARSVDIAIMGRPPRAPLVDAEPIGPHPHVMIAAPSHPLAGQAHVDPPDLTDETFIAREEGSGTRILMSRYLDRIGQGHIYDMMVMGSNETIKQAVIAGLGIAVISEHTVVEELRTGRLVKLQGEGLPILRQWFLVKRADTAPTPAAARVETAISDLGGSFLPSAEAAS